MVVDTFADATHVEKMLEERRLISRILSGDATAERQLYDTHVDRVFRLAYRMTGDVTQAEDLTQDTFIRAFDRLADFRMDGPFAGWLHRVATSVILTGLRKRKRLQSVESVRDDLEWAAGAGMDSDPDLKRSIDRAVSGLDDNHRLVFVMHDMEGYTHQEIATAVDAPVGTIKARLSSGPAETAGRPGRTGTEPGDEMMDDKDISEMARRHNEPPEVPRDRMWARIDAARADRRQVVTADFQPRRSPAFRILRLTAAVAAVLVLGILIGRMTQETGTPPVIDSAPVAVVSRNPLLTPATCAATSTPWPRATCSDGPTSCSPISRCAPAARTT